MHHFAENINEVLLEFHAKFNAFLHDKIQNEIYSPTSKLLYIISLKTKWRRQIRKNQMAQQNEERQEGRRWSEESSKEAGYISWKRWCEKKQEIENEREQDGVATE